MVYNVQRWVDEQIFMMKSEVVSQPSVASDLVQSVDQKKICESSSKFQNFHDIFHKFHALFSMRLS
jgi:hypothetical protein